MKRFALLCVALCAIASFASASEPSSLEILNKAESKAIQEHKSIFVIFHASWCGWCKKLDEFLKDPAMGKLMSDNFVVVHLDVMEHEADKMALQNAGGEDLMKQWNGEQAGLPFMVVLDPSGKKLIDSNLTEKQTSNIGYPAKPEEIAHFMRMLSAAPGLNASQKTQIQTWLTVHAPSG